MFTIFGYILLIGSLGFSFGSNNLYGTGNQGIAYALVIFMIIGYGMMIIFGILSLISLTWFLFYKEKKESMMQLWLFIKDLRYLFTTICIMFVLLLMGFKFNNDLLLFLIINIGLAYLVYAVGQILNIAVVKEKKYLYYPLLIIWILLFPNAIYIFTDFIHLQNYTFWENLENMSIYVYDMESWIVLFSIVSLSLYGAYLGIKSTYHVVSGMRFSKVSKIILINVLFLASSFGIYLGRFIRLNSWNVFDIFKHINVLTQGFTWLFVFGFFGVHWLLWRLLKPKGIEFHF